MSIVAATELCFTSPIVVTIREMNSLYQSLSGQMIAAIKSGSRSAMEATREKIIEAKRETLSNDLRRQLFTLVAKINTAILRLEEVKAQAALDSKKMGLMITARKALVELTRNNMFAEYKEGLMSAIAGLDNAINAGNEHRVRDIVNSITVISTAITRLLNETSGNLGERLRIIDQHYARLDEKCKILDGNRFLCDAWRKLMDNDTEFAMQHDENSNRISLANRILPELRKKYVVARAVKDVKKKRHEENRQKRADANRSGKMKKSKK